MSWETVIGLEVHVQLATKTKIFSNAPTKFGAAPNSQANIIDLAMPGVLPVLNREAVTMAIKLGLAVDAEICQDSVFARKNYFYPDLPKGYQISQFDKPIVGLGHLDITLENGEKKRIGVTRAHLEEDAGKSLHEDFQGFSGIDLNRAGIPLLEIVSEPDMSSPQEAIAYLKTLHSLVRYLEISDANMQEGSFRCDANVSVRKKGSSKLGTRSEIKNLNSFKFIEKAINFEVARHIDILESGGEIVQETRLYDSDKDETRSMRSKEEATDYRYFSDPDLLPVIIEDKFIKDIRNNLPELPHIKFERFIKDYGLTKYDSSVLTSNKFLANYYEDAIKQAPKAAKKVANWVTVELLGILNKNDLDINNSPIASIELGNLVAKIDSGDLSGKMAKEVFEALWHKEGTVAEIIEKRGLKQVTDTKAIEELCQKIIDANPNQLEQYRSGKDKLFGFFVGQVMKESKGQANPEQVNEILKKLLG